MHNKNETNQTVYVTYNNNDLSVSSFISYLMAALYRQGIDAVVDKTGNKLDGIRFADIKLFVVVFSVSYAFSVACLEKLVKLLEFIHKEGHVVVPVFYDPVHKQQMETFGEAFEMLEKSYSVEQVTRWRYALEQTMKLQGHEYTDELREQSKFIEEIARGVFEKLNPTEHIGIDKVLKELEHLLCKQPWGFRSIGIFGTHGIGKTTLAKAAFRRMSGGYDASRFVESSVKIVELFSEEDFKQIPVKKFDINNQDAKPCYRRKRVLLALDDVRNIQDAESFLRGFRRFGPGSLLIITSRDREVLEECQVNEIYELKGLNKEDSMKLFTRCLYGEDVVEEKLSKLSVEEIERYDGNPSSIRAYAMKMKSKKTIAMELALRRSCHDWFINTNNGPWEEYKGFQDYTCMESTIVTDLLTPTEVLNLCGCIEIKHFPDFVQTVRELKVEGKLMKWRLQTDPLCPLCTSTNETESHLYFDFTFSWSVGTTISNRFNALVNLTGTKAMDILSRMTWQLNNYGLWIERNHRLYRQNYRSTNLHRFIRYITRLRKKKPKMAFKIFRLLVGASSSR